MSTNVPVVVRFWTRVDKTGDCWLWTGTRNKDTGYASFSVNGRMVAIHRWAYAEAYGPIPEGMTIDHQCHNDDEACTGGPACVHRRCVRPDHLRARPIRENTRKSRYTIASINAAKTHCPQGHLLIPDPVRNRRYCLECQRTVMRESMTRRRRAAGIPAGRGIHGIMKTHCPKGHEYTPENTRVKNGTRRECRTCERDRNRLRQAKRREAA